MREIGKTKYRIDAFDKVTGAANYPGDINYPNQLIIKTLFAKHKPAIIKKVHTVEAERIPGVVKVLTAKDVPNNEQGIHRKDTPVLCGPGSSKKYADRIRYYGDQVAIIIAETEAIAKKALYKIKIEYEDINAVFDPLLAMDNNAPLVHPELGSNIFCHYPIRKGDIETGFQEADIIIEDEYYTGLQEHAFLQPEAGVAFIDEKNRINVITAGQWMHRDQEQIAYALGLHKDQIIVEYAAIGGAFGGREENSIQISLALAVWKLHNSGISRPVKIIWDRTESIIGHPKRHKYIIKTKWGAKRNGKLTAVEANIIQDGGAYKFTSSSVLGNTTLSCMGPYEIPNIKIDAFGVYTNNPPGGAFRGFGAPQGTFVSESQMNKLAIAISIDPVDFRLMNMVKIDGEFPAVAKLSKITVSKVLEKCADISGWKNKHSKEKNTSKHQDITNRKNFILSGVGIACGMKNTGLSFGAPEECNTRVELIGNADIEQANLYHAAAEVGQGVHTILIQMAAESLGVNPEIVKLISSDTYKNINSGPVSASRMTFMAGNAIIGASKNALKEWKNKKRPANGTYSYHPPKTQPINAEKGMVNNHYFSNGCAAIMVDLELDKDTGMVTINHVFVTADVGKIINPQLAYGQVDGAIVQALGYTLLEDMKLTNGKILANNFSKYLIPGSLDVPQKITTELLEYQDPIGPWGARGIGEIPFVPFPAATAAALHDATGVWFNEIPITPYRILKTIGACCLDLD